jgi:hypothetical protein
LKGLLAFLSLEIEVFEVGNLFMLPFGLSVIFPFGKWIRAVIAVAE